MSFILDALKKLEQKRQRGSVPDLMTIHMPEPAPQKKRPVWPYLLLAALMINAVVLTAWLRPWLSEPVKTLPEKQNVQKASPTEVKSPVTAASVKKPVAVDKKAPVTRSADTGNSVTVPDSSRTKDRPENAQAARESVKAKLPAAQPEKNITSTINQKVTSAPSSNTLRPKPAEHVPAPAEPAPPAAKKPDASGAIPELSQLPNDVQADIPPLSILGHIYSDSSTTRMVNINGDILREGDTVVKDLKVDQITENGVIFSYKGQRFSMRAF